MSDIKFTETLRKEIIRKINPQSFARAIGFEFIQDNGRELRGACPVHHGEDESAFALKYEEVDGEKTLFWVCHTDCATAGTIFTLIEKIHNCTFKEAVEWLVEFAGIENAEEFQSINNTAIKEVEAFNKEMRLINARPKRKPKHISPFLNEEFIKKCMERRNNYFNNRGFDDDILNLFEVGFCPAYDSAWRNDPYPERMTIPLRNKDGKLMGVSGRVIVDADVSDKYKILPGSNRSDYMYGSHLTTEYVAKAGYVILVEGFVDLWRSWQHGVKNVLAIMGKDLAPNQKNIILSGIHTIFIAVDNDKYGKKGGDRIQEELRDFLTVYRVSTPEEGMDVGDCNKEQYINSLKKAVKIN